MPQGAREAIAAIVRTIFAQPDQASALTQLRKVADGLRARFPRAAALLEEAAEDVLAYRPLPIAHPRQLHSTNPLERLNTESQRRSNVVGIFPNPVAVIRLVGAILLEHDDEWTVAERRYFSAESMTQRTTPTLSTTAQEIVAAIASQGHAVWALVETPVSRVFQEAVDGALPSTASSASMPISTHGWCDRISTT